MNRSGRCFNARKEGQPVTCLEKLSELPQNQRVAVLTKAMHKDQLNVMVSDMLH